MGGRFQIKANDLSGLGFKERIVALHVATHAVRAQPGAAPDASHPHMIKAKLLCQLARAPVGGSIIGRAAGAVQNTRRQGGALFVHRSAAVTGVKSSQPLGHKALLPAADVALPQRSAARMVEYDSPLAKRKINSARRASSARAERARIRRLSSRRSAGAKRTMVDNMLTHIPPVSLIVNVTRLVNLDHRRAFLWTPTTAARDRRDPWVVEIVADVNLRNHFGLQDGDVVEIRVTT